MQTLEPILAQHPFFKGFKAEHLKLLTGCAKNVRYKPGEIVIKEEQEANEFFLLREGKIALEINVPGRGPTTIQTLEGGEILGWSWLVPPYLWMFGARAVEPTRALSLDGKCLRGKLDKDHDLGYELLKRFSHIMGLRLQWTRMQLIDMYANKR